MHKNSRLCCSLPWSNNLCRIIKTSDTCIAPQRVQWHYFILLHLLSFNPHNKPGHQQSKYFHPIFTDGDTGQHRQALEESDLDLKSSNPPTVVLPLHQMASPSRCLIQVCRMTPVNVSNKCQILVIMRQEIHALPHTKLDRGHHVKTLVQFAGGGVCSGFWLLVTHSLLFCSEPWFPFLSCTGPERPKPFP